MYDLTEIYICNIGRAINCFWFIKSRVSRYGIEVKI